MNLFLALLAYFASSLLGYFFLRSVSTSKSSLSLGLILFLSPGLGLALTAIILFNNFILFDKLNRLFVFIVHGVVALLLILFFFLTRQKSKSTVPSSPSMNIFDLLSFVVLLFMIIPLWKGAHIYPMGGWDAWQVWNFKAKFLLLGGQDWKNMLEVSQWRSSPHYPLMLPLVIVWGWLWTSSPSIIVPILVSVMYTFLTGGLLFAGLRQLTQSRQAILAALALLSLPFFILIGTSQYCDVLLSYYLLASIICSLVAYQQRDKITAFWAGIFLGILSFTKPEGTLAAFILFILNLTFLRQKNLSIVENKKIRFALILGAFLFTLPTILFELVYSPGNQTFINGLSSSTKPSDWPRLQLTLVVFFATFLSQHWNGLWLVMLGGLLLSWKKSFQKNLILIPLFLGIYFAVIIFYYWLNTYFEIAWWLRNTLGRILVTLLPVALLWTFYALGQPENKEKQN